MNDNNNIESFDSLFIKTCFLIGQVKLINPIKVYNNFKEDILQLINDPRNKAGIYCLVNLINGHTYIGSPFALLPLISPSGLWPFGQRQEQRLSFE